MKFLRDALKRIGSVMRTAKTFIEVKPKTALRNSDFVLRAKAAEDMIRELVFPRFPGHSFKNFILNENLGYAGVEIHHETGGHVANIHFMGSGAPFVEYTPKTAAIGEAIAKAFHKSAGFRLGWKSAAFIQKKKLLPVSETVLS